MCSSLASTHLIQRRQANKATECIMFLQVKQVKLLTAHLAPGVKLWTNAKSLLQIGPTQICTKNRKVEMLTLILILTLTVLLTNVNNVIEY